MFFMTPHAVDHDRDRSHKTPNFMKTEMREMNVAKARFNTASDDGVVVDCPSRCGLAGSKHQFNSSTNTED